MLSVFDGSEDGSVRIQGEDRAGLERLLRHCARGPLVLAPNARLRSAVVSIGRPESDESPAVDLAVHDPVPEFEFDPSAPQGWEI